MILLSDRIEEKLESKINSKLSRKQKSKSLYDGFKKNKVVNEVLDKPTILELYELIKSNIILYVNGVVKSGKESVVFWAIGPNQSDIAIKVYLVTTSNFTCEKGHKKYCISMGKKRISKYFTMSELWNTCGNTNPCFKEYTCYGICWK